MIRSSFTWGTVTGVSPLRVKLDGDAAEIASTPDSLVDPTTLVVTDRVRCEMWGTKLIVLGRGGGSLGASDAETIAGLLRTRFVTPASLAAKVATATAQGIIETATPAEAQAMTDTVRAVTAEDLQMPFISMKRNAVALSIPNNAVTNITAAASWTQVTKAGAATPAGTLVALLTGRYLLTVGLKFAAFAAGTREIFVNKNNATYTTNPLMHAYVGLAAEVMGAREVELTAGDALRVFAYQANGGAVNVDTDPNMSWVTLRYLGPA